MGSSKGIIATVSFLAVIFSLVFLGACSSHQGEVQEVGPKEIKQFTSEKGTGFVVLSFRENERNVVLPLYKEVAKEQNVVIKELDNNRSDMKNVNTFDYGIGKQKYDSIAFYKDGKMVSSFKYKDTKKPDELKKEIETFVKTNKN
ncbi:hypothetical protein CUC43_34080 (plasmid) [Bacillus thuringiensis LM1212]|uniref:hypothetical protein n=1 Tax=Bacillus cereus group TaxID=86661 RepID=UPI0003F78CDA|nr:MULTISPECIES: hypothetical protein [Bacillus cereus group]AXY11588.1 hypothetical protein CUC43_34080 [Bacillus thuringiensis LM1212]QDF27442.1 hypothetical protein FJR70_32420 [Bacillus tropicus]QUG99315.1 hypothetical protein HCM98_31365 [Bacillus tropicus]